MPVGISPWCGSKEERTSNIFDQECSPRPFHQSTDPHKATHTAVAIDGREVELARLKVRASKRQSGQLLAWAGGFEDRAWAIESAGGLGYLLAQQLLAAGETVLDVPATLAARVRVLGTGHSDKNDPNDARSVAVAALRAPMLTAVRCEDHLTVLRMLAKRHLDLARMRREVSRHSRSADLSLSRDEAPVEAIGLMDSRVQCPKGSF